MTTGEPDDAVPTVPDDWPRSVLKVRVDGVRGGPAADAISRIEGLVRDRVWLVSSHETRETWFVLHQPAGRGRSGELLSPAADRAALADFLGLVSAVETASVITHRAFVLLLDDEEVGSVADGRHSRELERDVIAPWREKVGD